MSRRLTPRWPSAAALLAAGALTSAAVAQQPEPAVRPAPQTAPAAVAAPLRPVRLSDQPQLIEEEQTSEHADGPHAAPPSLPTPPRVYRGGGMPECDRDDGRMAPEEVALRCLLFTLNPLAAFLPMRSEVEVQTLPPPAYVNHPPQYVPPSPAFPVSRDEPARPVGTKQAPELLEMPQEVERLQVMPVEAERLDVLPVEEESEPKVELLAPWVDYTRWFQAPAVPRADVMVSVQEAKTGSLLFGIGAEVNRTGTITVSTEPQSAVAPASAPRDADARPTAPQVQVNVLVAEVTGKGARKLHLDASAEGKASPWVIDVADEARQKELEARLRGLRDKGHAKVLAEPRLVVLSGQQGNFLSGGERAVPVTSGPGQASVEYEEFGTHITCQPTVLAGGTIHLEVEPEISEFCEVGDGCPKGARARSALRVHTAADVAPGHTLVIAGPKAGGDARLVLFVTPSVVEEPAAKATPGVIPQLIFDFGNAVRGCLDFIPVVHAYPSDPNRRVEELINQSENLRRYDYETERTWMVDQPSRLTPERVQGGAVAGGEETVHDLLVKCRRELSRNHFAAAEDLAQRAIERDRKAVADDPLVRESDLLQRVKAIAALPLGTVDPCAAKGAGGGFIPAGAAKPVGSDERVVEALMQEFNAAYQAGRFGDAEALAESARERDPENATVVAALQVARAQAEVTRLRAAPVVGPVVRVAGFQMVSDNAVAASAPALAQFQGNFREGRYEEAKADALRALAAAPGDSVAAAALRQACEALGRQPQPQSAPQCTYVGTSPRPMLPRVDPAVVGALQKLLIEGDKGGPFGGSEEAEPKDDSAKPRR